MALQVTLVKTPGGVSLSRTSHLFNEQGGTFGRAPTNSWQLPDPDKFLSSCHCEIVYISDAYYLVDRSTNGTFLNGSPEPIGRGVKSPISEGDVFEIGDYRFSVSISGTASSPFDDQPLFSSPSSAGIFDSPFDHHSAADNTPFFEQPLDPLAIWDKVAKSHEPRSGSLTDIPLVTSSSSIDDIFGNETTHAQPHFAPVDVSHNIDQAVVWPTATRENLIPEDWEDDFSDLANTAFGNQPLIVPASTSPTSPQFASVGDVVIPLPRAAREPLAERLAATESRIVAASIPAENPPTIPAPSHNESLNVIAPASQAIASQSDYSFITAMGLDPSRLTEGEIAEIADTSGKLMREIVEGMMGVLRSRTSIKNEFRMNVTTIQPVENNPLKFSVSVDDALENMFLKKSNAYKKPVDAFKEGFQEIAEHQVAMIGGIRQGFERMMERFNPENLEKNFNKQGRNAMLPGMQKAKYWSSYKDYYSGFTDNMESSFQHLFGSDFVSAYEDQLRRLAAARKKG